MLAELLQEVAHDYKLGTMAPLDLDKYAEIAKQCKYLPENDLKVNVTLYKCVFVETCDGLLMVCCNSVIIC